MRPKSLLLELSDAELNKKMNSEQLLILAELIETNNHTTIEELHD
ncbi:hypothetical protein QUA32_25400 [Microcoleus sp. Pol14D6]